MACSLGSPVEPQYSGQQEAWQSTVNSQGSCFPVLVSVAVCVRAVGKALPPFPLRNGNPSIPQRGELLSAFLLPQDAVSPQCSMLPVPKAGHRRAPELPAGRLGPSPGVHCCCCRWRFHLPDPTAPEFSTRAQDCGVCSSSLQSPLQSLHPSAALANQCLTLV